MQKKFKLEIKACFIQDLDSIVDYIAGTLNNPDAAQAFYNKVEGAIKKRLDHPTAFEVFKSNKKRKYPYYRIYVDHFTIFYIVRGTTMEVRRLLYNRRNFEKQLDE